MIILKGSETEVRIDTFLMSCRVMGRKLEDVIINELAAHYTKKMIGEFIPISKNALVKKLYDRLGFKHIFSDDGYKIYELNAISYMKKLFDSYKEIKYEG